MSGDKPQLLNSRSSRQKNSNPALDHSNQLPSSVRSALAPENSSSRSKLIRKSLNDANLIHLLDSADKSTSKNYDGHISAETSKPLASKSSEKLLPDETSEINLPLFSSQESAHNFTSKLSNRHMSTKGLKPLPSKSLEKSLARGTSENNSNFNDLASLSRKPMPKKPKDLPTAKNLQNATESPDLPATPESLMSVPKPLSQPQIPATNSSDPAALSRKSTGATPACSLLQTFYSQDSVGDTQSTTSQHSTNTDNNPPATQLEEEEVQINADEQSELSEESDAHSKEPRADPEPQAQVNPDAEPEPEPDLAPTPNNHRFSADLVSGVSLDHKLVDIPFSKFDIK